MPKEREKLPLAGNIRILRKRRGLSQAALGAAVGLTRSNIASYENAKAEPRASKLAELAQFFKVSLERLITGEFPEQPLEPYRTPNEIAEDLRRQLTGFEERNQRLKRMLRELERQHVGVRSDLSGNDELRIVVKQFEHLLVAMNDLVRNDEEMAEVLQRTVVTDPLR